MDAINGMVSGIVGFALPAAEDGADALAAGPPSGAAGNAGSLATDSEIAVACPSITQPQTRQVGLNSSPLSLQGFFNVDWFESAGCVQWDRKSDLIFDELQRCQYQAEQCRQPVPCSLGGNQIFVHERGMGSGRASRLEFRLEYRGVTIGLSARNEATRLLSNFALKIPGEACLIHGFEEIRQSVLAWLVDWGGDLKDEWIRRLDLCLDLPGFDLHQTVFPACQAGQYLSTMRRNSSHRDCDRTTGFAIGSSPGARLTIYDKLAEVKHKNDTVYATAMVQRRWNGVFPESAGRVEYQLHREFFQQFEGLKKVEKMLARLPDVVERLIQTEHRPFFQLTDAVPDRKGRHQGRVGILAEWAAIIALIREQVGQPREPLLRIERHLIDAKRACANVVGYLTSAAAQLGSIVTGKSDLIEFFRDLLERNDVNDDVIRLKCEDKARRYGTFDEVSECPFGMNQAV